MTNGIYLKNAYEQNKSEWKSANAEPVKMIYMNHKIGNNYLSACGCDDNGVKRDIVMTEIGKLIINQPCEVDRLLKKNNQRVPTCRTRSQYVSAVTDGLHNSQGFAKDIAGAIASNRGSEGSLSAEGDKADVGGILQGAAALTKGLGDLFGGKKRAQKAQAEAEKAKADAARALAEATKGVAAGKGISTNIGRNIAIAVGVAGVLGAGWYFFIKK